MISLGSIAGGVIKIPRVQIMDEHVLVRCPRCSADDKEWCDWCGGRRVIDYDIEEYVSMEDKPKDVLFIDKARLEKIAEVMNYRANTTRDVAAIVVGHTVPMLPESKQPKVVGYADNFQVVYNRSVDGYGDVYALACDFNIYGQEEEVLLRYPRKSVEFDLTKNIIDPIALLGASVPARRVGWVLMNSKNGPERVRYNMGDVNMAENGGDKILAELSKLQETCDMLSKKIEKCEEFCKKYEEDVGRIVAQYESEHESAQAGPNNVYVPTLEEHERLKKEYEELALKYKKLERISALRELKETGKIDLDENEEWEFCKDLTDEQFKGHLERIKRRYRRIDSAASVVPIAGLSESYCEGYDKENSDADVKLQDEIIRYALRKGLSYLEAKEELLKNKANTRNVVFG